MKEQDVENANKKLAEKTDRIAELTTEVRRLGELLQQAKQLEAQKQETEKKLKHTQELLDNELRKKENIESGYGPNNVLYVDDEAQTEAERTGLDPAMLDVQQEGVVDYSQQNSFQNTTRPKQ